MCIYVYRKIKSCQKYLKGEEFIKSLFFKLKMLYFFPKKIIFFTVLKIEKQN